MEVEDPNLVSGRMEGFPMRFSCEYIRFQCGPTENAVDAVYALLQHTTDTLVIHKDLEIRPSLKLLRKSRDRVKIVIEEEKPFQAVVDHLNSFNTFILLGYEFNNFEHEFLRQASMVNRKSILLFSEVQMGHAPGGESYRLVNPGSADFI